jgi:NTP pyrophosphatase (non-canonical NTP hydrolase)
MTKLETQIKTFADERWPNRTPFSKLRKLGEEFGELSQVCANYDGGRFGRIAAIKEEAADMAIVLSDFVSLFGGSLEEEMIKKMRTNVRDQQMLSTAEYQPARSTGLCGKKP